MWTYNAPLRDMHFVIEEVLKAPTAWAQTPACYTARMTASKRTAAMP